MNKYNVGNIISPYRAEKYEREHGPSDRLLLAFMAVLTIATLYSVLIIQICAGACMFVPN